MRGRSQTGERLETLGEGRGMTRLDQIQRASGSKDEACTESSLGPIRMETVFLDSRYIPSLLC